MSHESQHSTTTPIDGEEQRASSQLIHAIDCLMLGIVRLFIGRVTFDVLVERLRHVMVQEGSRRIAKENGGKVVKSRIALLTGVKTEHIGRALKQTKEDCQQQSVLTVEARILNAWSKDPLHLDAKGQPKQLHIYGNGDTFQRLVAIHAGRGVTPQTVLDSLLKAQNVEIVDQHWVRMVNPVWNHYTPDESNMLKGASFTVNNLLNTIQWNLEHFDAPEHKRTERNIWSVSLPPEKVPLLRQRLNQVLKNSFEDCRAEIKQLEDPQQTEYNTVLVGAGMFYWEQDACPQNNEFNGSQTVASSQVTSKSS